MWLTQAETVSQQFKEYWTSSKDEPFEREHLKNKSNKTREFVYDPTLKN